MKKTLLALVYLIVLTVPLTVTAQTNPPVPPGFEQATNQAGALPIFNSALNLLPSWDPTLTNSFSAKEFTLESAPLWKTATASGTTPYNSTEADYFFTKNIGGGPELVSLGNGSGGNSVDSFNGVLTLRKDSGNIAGYLLVSGGWDLKQNRAQVGVGPGLIYQYKTHLRLFVDTRFTYEKLSTVKSTTGSLSVGGSGFATRVGLQIPF